MLLNLEKPIVFFDLETTGVNVGTDHIVEICLYKVNPDQSTEQLASVPSVPTAKPSTYPKSQRPSMASATPTLLTSPLSAKRPHR